MQLLGWMHRKFRQNSNEQFKDLVMGQQTLDDEFNYPKPNFGTKHVKQTHKDHNQRKSFAGSEAARTENDEYDEESSDAMYDLFHGFLTIGTLGSEQAVADASQTPTFAFYVENITEKEDEVTENELKLINYELEKVLAAETKDDCSNYDSSARSSLVSNARSSYGSTITLSGKPLEGANESNVNGSAICPLQGYLFGSGVELSETKMAAKKENRTSLGELFQKSKLEEENFGAKCEKDDRRTEREAYKSAMQLVKKKLKIGILHTVDPASAEKKLHKILHMFNKKVHPENSTAAQKRDKQQQKNEKKKKIMNDGGNRKSDVVHPEEDIILYPNGSLVKENIEDYKSQSNPLHFRLSTEEVSYENQNKEHWIKTDADYLVLEL
ncbi:PREDICTED: protein LAZY 1-like isoform X2 [Lupinus angustifolius]|uniref:protein LAZY 1-like isoform X2 n=1 Tax=Lupinus angustifolius TaxID=3871 RepID=UPI00092E9547|nr:PREDICTED: protein LAZY 1-like isoform X2 [Lupinus angustifolius]